MLLEDDFFVASFPIVYFMRSTKVASDNSNAYRRSLPICSVVDLCLCLVS